MWRALSVVAALVAQVIVAPGAFAADKLKVAIGQIDAWANMMPTLGMKAGIFQKHGIELENFGTQGAGETLQAVISGSADLGIGIGTSGAMRAFVKGAPVRVHLVRAIPACRTSSGTCRRTRRSRRLQMRPTSRRCPIPPTVRPRTTSRSASSSSSA